MIDRSTLLIVGFSFTSKKGSAAIVCHASLDFLGPAAQSVAVAAVTPQGTAFTYQGELRQSGLPVTDTSPGVDLVFLVLATNSRDGAIHP